MINITRAVHETITLLSFTIYWAKLTQPRVTAFSAIIFAFTFQLHSHANAPEAALVKGDKIALVIGNAEYKSSPLVNPPNDARIMADILRQSGVEVYLMLNADSERMRQGVTQLHKRASAKTVNTTLFYYAGHGMQLDWRNFLIGVDARISKPEDVPQFSLDLTDVVSIKRGNDSADNDHQLVVILDSCRDNPFRQSINLAQKGLSQMDAPPNTLLAFSTAPGQFAFDGEGENSIYTSMLVKELATPNVSLETALKRVRTGVRIASLGQQIPWESTSLESSVYLRSQGLARRSGGVEELDALIKEQFTEWERIKNAEDIPGLASFLQKYPDGPMNQLAQFKLDALLTKRIRDEARQTAENQRRLEAERAAVEQRLAAAQAEKQREAEVLAMRQRQESDRLVQEQARKENEARVQRDAEQAALRARQETERKFQEQLLAAEIVRKQKEAEVQAMERHQKELELSQLQATEKEAARRRQESERLLLEERRMADDLRRKQESEAIALRQRVEAETLARDQQTKAEAAKLLHQEELLALKKQQESKLAKAADDARLADATKMTATAPVHKTSPLILALLEAAQRINVKPVLAASALNTVPELPSQQVNSTPFFKGAEPIGRRYIEGDKYTYIVVNRMTGHTSQQTLVVTKVDESRDHVEYNQGEFTSDLMGNATNTDRGQLSSPRQFYPSNLQIGERWESTFFQNRPSGNTQYFKYDVRVVAKEKLTVPAGTFDTFRIQAIGRNVGQGHRIERTLWVTPGVNVNIATEVKTFSPRGALEQHDRRELNTYQSSYSPKTLQAL